MDLTPPLDGHQIDAFISTPQSRRKSIVEGLIYERSCVMFASHPGVGKSILTIQMALEISSGLPVFSAFPSVASRIYYIQKERSFDEIAERIEVMQKSIFWNRKNLFVDPELQTFNLALEKNHQWIIDRVAKYKPDVIIIDPIGSGTPGLSRDEQANIFCSFLTALQKRTGATNILNHHITKDTYSQSSGEKIEKDDPFYGSQWIKAHVTGSYLIKETDDGRVFLNKKDSHSNLLSKFNIVYDPERMISTATHRSMQVKDKLYQYCLACRSQNKTFTIKEATLAVGCDKRTLLRVFVIPPFDTHLKRVNSSGYATLYEVLDTL